MDTYGVLWIVWGVAFAGIEGSAFVFTKHGAGTLSDHLRLWLHTNTKGGRTAWALGGGALIGWFIVHIAMAGAVFP